MTNIFADVLTYSQNDYDGLRFAVEYRLEWLYDIDIVIAYKALLSMSND